MTLRAWEECAFCGDPVMDEEGCFTTPEFIACKKCSEMLRAVVNELTRRKFRALQARVRKLEAQAKEVGDGDANG